MMQRRAHSTWLAVGGIAAIGVAAVCGAFHVLVGSPSTWAPVGIGCAAAIAAGAAAASIPLLRPVGGRALREAVIGLGVIVLVLATYLVVVVGFNGAPHSGERRVLVLSMVAAVIALVVVIPGRARLLEAVSRWSAAEASAPTTALETFGARMTRAVPMDELLLQLAETLKATVAPAGAEIWTGTDRVLEQTVSVPERPRPRIELEPQDATVVARARATGNAWASIWLPALLDGREHLQVRIAPVAHLGQLLGLIVVTRAPTDPAYDDEIDGVLADIARQVGLALHNVRLDSALQASLEELRQRNEELQTSRARIVAASDETRRTIERNLHDGAQQHLVALAVKIGLARQLLGDNTSPTATLLEELRGDVQTTINEVRELAHGIYPPLLRDRGLGEALATAGGRCPLPVDVQVEAGDRYPAEAEAAVYFCCLEALQNASKYAGADATVTVSVVPETDGLRFCIRDNGVGFDVDTSAMGHGFVNMTDRLGAMGGRLDVDSARGRGTSIKGFVPCAPLPVSSPAVAPAPRA